MWRLRVLIVLFVFFMLVPLWLPLGLLVLGAIALEDRHKHLVLAHCYNRNRSNWECAQKPCFFACCAFREDRWVENLERRAGRGDAEAIASLEFYYRY